MVAKGAVGAVEAWPLRAEVLATLSLALDLGLGQPMEHMLRSAIIACGLADRVGLDSEQRAVVYYCDRLAWIGCHADSHEVSAVSVMTSATAPRPTTLTSPACRCCVS